MDNSPSRDRLAGPLALHAKRPVFKVEGEPPASRVPHATDPYGV